MRTCGLWCLIHYGTTPESFCIPKAAQSLAKRAVHCLRMRILLQERQDQGDTLPFISVQPLYNQQQSAKWHHLQMIIPHVLTQSKINTTLQWPWNASKHTLAQCAENLGAQSTWFAWNMGYAQLAWCA